MESLQFIDLTGTRFKYPLPQSRIKQQVLLVEDSSESEDLIRKICESIDSAVTLKCVKTAEEALQLLKSNSHYDLIIADHYLAGEKTGLDLWKHCQKEQKRIPFMMTSSMTDEEFLHEIGPFGGFPSFLHKPFNNEEFKEMIERRLAELPKKTSKILLPKTLFERLYNFLWTFGLLALLLIPTYLKNIEKVFENTPREEIPQKIKTFEKFMIPLTPPSNIDFYELFTPDILKRVGRLEREAKEMDEIFEIRSPHPAVTPVIDVD